MKRRILTWGLGLVLVAAFAFPALADQSIGYQEYFNKGVAAFNEHDDQKAFRCFKIAQIYDPKSEDLNRYLDVLEQRGVSLELHPSQLPPEQTIGFRYYFSGGVEAFNNHNDEKAIRYFKIAKIFNPYSAESDEYLKILYQRQGLSYLPENLLGTSNAEEQRNLNQESAPTTGPNVQGVSEPVESATQTNETEVQPKETQSSANQEKAVQPTEVVSPSNEETTAQPNEIASQASEGTTSPSEAMTQSTETSQSGPMAPNFGSAASSIPSIYVPMQKSNKPIEVLSLAQITNNGQIKPKLQIELNSSVIIEGKNIQRFLIVQEGYINAKIIDPNHLKIDAIRIGTTFLHVWDDTGRSTFYVEVIFPKSTNSNNSQINNEVQHSIPFTVAYTNDWDTYYSGKNIPDQKRQSYEFTQNLGINGETPYGLFDASGDYIDFNSITEFDSYTIGLSQIPVSGVSNFNLRAFDAERSLSPLTMPYTRLRGAFGDIDLFDNTLGISVSHGQEQVSPFGGIIPIGGKEYYNAHIDAAKITLFPTSVKDQYSFNFATAYGPDRPTYLTDHVYSLQGHHQFNDKLSLNAEEASDSSHDSSLAALRWQNGTFNTGLNFRNIDKDYSDISTLPAYQGETGFVWNTDGDFKKFTENTFVEAYRDRLDENPNNPGRYNFDANGQVRYNITPNVWSDTNFNYVDTPGELSPTNSIGFNERISRGFGIWNSLKGTVFTGAGYQDSHSKNSDITNYSRESVIAGIQLPLTRHISTYGNYEFDWEHQPLYGDSNPGIVNAGISYENQLTSKLSFTTQADYHDELGVKSNTNSFLSGERSIILTSGLNYTPTPDWNIFGDVNASKVLSHIDNPSYDDFEVHLGVRLIFGGATYWDPLGTVSGIVYKDRNGNGRFGPGDQGIAGVKIMVGDKQVITDKNGRYQIKIRAKGVTVQPILDSVPGGLIFSTPQSLNVMIVQGHKSQADFGLIVQTGIYGLVYVDKAGNGVPTEGDIFVGKVKVILDGKASQKSDSHGSFYFRDVIPGKHVISIDLNSLDINMVPSIKLQNQIDVAEGSNYQFNIPVQIKQAQADDSSG